MTGREGKGSSGDNKVIRIAFTKNQDSAGQARAEKQAVAHHYSRPEVAKLLNVSVGRLRTLDRNGIVSPSGRQRGTRTYTFTDLIAVRTAQTLLGNKTKLRDVARAVAGLRRALPSVPDPLSKLRVVSDGGRITVNTEEGQFNPETGQLLLDLEVKSLREDVVRTLRPVAGPESARAAYELYLRATELDEEPDTMQEGERLYREAIKLDPWLAIAYTNLGNIRFRCQDAETAEELYRKALDIDHDQPEAQYNLGYVILERGEADAAIPLFQGAISADPEFSDAYFNLAMAFEQVGRKTDAKPYWRDYIRLEPQGTWTEIARRHL